MRTKKYLTIDEQIAFLKSKNLNFKNEKLAKIVLKEIGYYKLINAYRSPFLINVNGEKSFSDNVDFNDLYNLYKFDRDLKTIVFEATTNIEINFKSLLADIISNNYGIKNSQYLKEENFQPDTGTADEYSFKYMKTRINKEIKKQYDNNHPSIKWYKENYGYYPFWVVCNILTIGSVSRIYTKLKVKDQIEISKNYHLPNTYLASYIKHINLVRNICAHNDILYKYKSINSIPQKVEIVKNIFGILKINKNEKTGRYINGSNDFLATIIIFKLLLSKENYNLFKTQYKGLINKLRTHFNEENYNKIMNEMGVPTNWDII